MDKESIFDEERSIASRFSFFEPDNFPFDFPEIVVSCIFN